MLLTMFFCVRSHSNDRENRIPKWAYRDHTDYCTYVHTLAHNRARARAHTHTYAIPSSRTHMSFTVPPPPPAHSFIIGPAVINTHLVLAYPVPHHLCNRQVVRVCGTRPPGQSPTASYICSRSLRTPSPPNDRAGARKERAWVY
jgi:hypothetical protein